MSEPPVTLRARFSSFAADDNVPPTRVVIHATCPGIGYPAASAAGQAAATARYFASAAAGGSAHYIEDIAAEQHCVPDATIAYHAPPNRDSLGIEICGEATYTRDQWLSPAVWPAVAAAAARARELCDRHGIPLAYIGPAALLAGAHGICGHADVSQAWRQSTHTDPGPGFPWPEFLTAVQAADPLEDDVSAIEVWDTPVKDQYKPGLPDMPAHAALEWAAAHAAQALDEARAAHQLAQQTLDEVKALRAGLGK